MSNEWISSTGIIQRIVMQSDRIDLFSALVEQFHSPVEETKEKQVHWIHKFTFEGKQYFLVAKKNYISKNNAINRFLKISPPKKVSANQVDISYHGWGSKFIFFKVEAEKTYFFTHDYIYEMGDLSYECDEIRKLPTLDMNSEENINKFIHSYSPRPARKIDIINSEAFKNTIIGKMIEQREFQSFILFETPNKVRNPELSSENDEEWNNLRTKLEAQFSVNIQKGQMEIYMGKDVDTRPEVISFPRDICLLPCYWLHSFVTEIRLNEEEKKGVPSFWENKAKWLHPTDNTKNVFFRFISNITGRKELCIRYQKSPPIESFSPHVRITVARVKDEYLLDRRKEDLGAGVYVIYGSYLLNSKPFPINNQLTRNLPKGSNYRIICEVLDEGIMNIKRAGIDLAQVKVDSRITPQTNIYKSIEDMVRLSKRWFEYLDDNRRLDSDDGIYKDSDEDFLSSILDYTHKAKTNAEASKKASKNGCKIEQMIGDLCSKEIQKINNYTLEWIHGDAIIMSKFELDKQGIDSLCVVTDEEGNDVGYLSIQVKSKLTITDDDIHKFHETNKNFLEKINTSNFNALMIIKGNATLKPATMMNYQTKGIFVFLYPQMLGTSDFVKDIINDIKSFMQNKFTQKSITE